MGRVIWLVSNWKRHDKKKEEEEKGVSSIEFDLKQLC